MGTLVVQDTIDKIRLVLVDEAAVNWADADLIADYNEACRQIALANPDAYVLTEPIALVIGTIQSLPENGTELVDMSENSVSKQRVTQVDLELLDETYRFWPAGTTQADVEHFCFDPRDKTQFRIYPPNDGSGLVISTYTAVPDPVSYLDVIPFKDSYEPALVLLILSIAYRQNTQRQDLAKSEGYFKQGMQMLGLGAQSQAAIAPSVSRSPGS